MQPIGNRPVVKQFFNRRFANDQLVSLGGFRVQSWTRAAFIERMADHLATRQPAVVCFANTNLIVQCQHLRAVMRQDNWYLVNDGIGLDLAALLIHGKRFPANLAGTDLLPQWWMDCTDRKQRLRFFLLGGTRPVLDAASRRLEAMGHLVVGTCDGYQQLRHRGSHLLTDIHQSQADVLIVALGNPQQEAWIASHADQLHVPVTCAVGALLDFLSGRVVRAPHWVRRLRCEWVFRLLLEPRRLCRRYTIDVLRFFWVCWRARCPRYEEDSSKK